MKKDLYAYTFLAYSLVTVIFVAIYISLMGFKPLTSYIKNDFFSLVNLFIFLSGVVIHEIIHYLCFRLANVEKDKVKIGFSLKSLMPYVHCKAIVSRNVYIFSAISPFVLLALIPLCASLLLSSTPLFVFSLFMAKGAAGDLASILLVLTRSNKQSNILDSKEFGFEVRS